MQSIVKYVANDLLMIIILLVCIASYFYITRFKTSPALVITKKFYIWWVDIFIFPLFVILAIALLKHLDRLVSIGEVIPDIDFIRLASLYFIAFWLIARGIDIIFLSKRFYARTGFTAPNLLRGIMYTVVLFIGLAHFLWRIDYQVTGFLVSTGVAAGIIGLSLQSSLSDLFSGIAMSLEKPFKVSDWIELSNKTLGQVVDITWRSTWIKTFNNTIITIPNSTLASQQITNLTNPNAPYALWYSLKLSASIEPVLIKTLLTKALSNCKHVLKKPVPSVRLNNAEQNPYIYTVWVHYRSFLAHFKGQEELFSKIHSTFKQAGIEMASPIQDLTISRKTALRPIAPIIDDTLRSLSIFSSLSDEEIDHIASVSNYVMVDADTELMHENQRFSKIYIIISGDLQSSVTLDDGKRILGEHFVAGDSFGWSAIVIEEVAFMTVTALSDSLILEINSQCLKPILLKHDELMQQFTQLVTERMQKMDKARLAIVENRRLLLSPLEIKKRIEKYIGLGTTG